MTIRTNEQKVTFVIVPLILLRKQQILSSSSAEFYDWLFLKSKMDCINVSRSVGRTDGLAGSDQTWHIWLCDSKKLCWTILDSVVSRRLCRRHHRLSVVYEDDGVAAVDGSRVMIIVNKANVRM